MGLSPSISERPSRPVFQIMSESSSHAQILKASSIIGGASVINILLGIVRTKILAVLLGPAGVGIAGMYQTVMGMASAVAGCGLASSGVRQLAESIGRNDDRAVSITRKVLWFASLGAGLGGAAILWWGREPVARWIFNDISEAQSIGLLGIGLIFGALAGSQTAVLQGFRRIGDQARVGIYGTLFGSLIAIGCVYALGRDGILWFVVVNPVVNVLIAWRYAARLPRPVHRPTGSEVRRELRMLLGLGFVFMSTGLISQATALGIRSLLIRDLGLESVGQFQAAWSISMQYIGFVLGAMAADYYPRLTAAIHDTELSNRMVNEQTEVALLLAGPVILGMLSFAPLVIDLLYAADFRPAVETLRWQVMGDLLKVFSWPIGFIMLAHGAGQAFFWTEAFWNLIFLGLVWVGLPGFALEATGIAFLCAYTMYLVLVYSVANRLNEFRWSSRNLRLFTGLMIAALLIRIGSYSSYVVPALKYIISLICEWMLNSDLSSWGVDTAVAFLSNIYQELSLLLPDKPLQHTDGTAIGLFLTSIFFVASIHRLNQLTDLTGRAATFFLKFGTVTSRPKKD